MKEILGVGAGTASTPTTSDLPGVEFREFRSLWFQLTGTLCNLACRHCLNASGPKNPWLPSLDAATVRRYIREAARRAAREFYFTGGEPFLHPDILPLLVDALAVAPTTVLTNGTLIDQRIAERLADIAAGSPYSLEIRVSLDGATARDNDRIRGRGSFARALHAIGLLHGRRLYPIVTATDVVAPGDRRGLYERLRARLLAAGVDRPRIKILPLLPAGRAACAGGRRLTSDDLEGFDPARLQCTETRAVAAGGIYACPILAGLPEARLAADALADALGRTRLTHAACVTCYQTGLTCSNG